MHDPQALTAVADEALRLVSFYEAAREVLRERCVLAGGDPALLDALMDTVL